MRNNANRTGKFVAPGKAIVNRFGRWLVRITDDNEKSSTVHVPAAALVVETKPTVLVPSGPAKADIELVTIGKVLALMERQLSEVSKDVEESVVGVCNGFQGMVKRAQEAVATASDSVGASVSADGTDLISEMQDVLGVLIERIQNSCDFSLTVCERLSQLESRLEDIETTLTDIEELASRARLVALNGQIEAARLGDAGQAFRVVAQETKDLSGNAGDTSTAIRELIGTLVGEIKKTSAELKSRSAVDLETFQDSQQQAVKLLKDIFESHRHITASLNKTGAISHELSREIGSAVMSMQFQDRVSQRIAHVTETLEMLVQRVASTAAVGSDEVAADECDRLLKQLSSRCTMESERVVLSNGHADNEAVEDYASVELF